MRLSLLLTLLLAAPSWAQDFDAVVLSQGAFGAQNSAVDLVGADDNGVFINSVASGRIYTQGAALIDGRLYLTAGSSFAGTDRVDVVDLETRQLVNQTTEGLLNPRYVAKVAEGKAYVTNTDFGGLSFVVPYDLATGEVGARIEVAGTAEDVTLAGTRAFVALGAFGGADSLAVIDPATDALEGYVNIGCAARFAVATFEALWAICTDTDEAVAVDPDALEVTQRVAFDAEIGDPNGSGQDAAPLQLARTARRANATEEMGDSVLISSDAGLIILQGDGEFTVVPIDGADTRPITALAAGLSVGGSGGGLYYLGRPDTDNPFSARGSVTVYSGSELVAQLDAGVFPSYIAPTRDFLFPADTDDVPSAAFAVRVAGPNPSRGRTALEVVLERPGVARVTVLDVTGRVVRDLEAAGVGAQRVEIDLEAAAPGVYLARVEVEGRAQAVALAVAR